MSRLSQRQGLCLSGWRMERLAWPTLPFFLPGKQWFHGKGCQEGEAGSPPAGQGAFRGGKDQAGPALLLGAPLQGCCLSLGIVGSLLPELSRYLHISLDLKSLIIFKRWWGGGGLRGNETQNNLSTASLCLGWGLQGSPSPCLLGICKGSFYETLYCLFCFSWFFLFVLFFCFFVLIYI